jgi:hypothetical protein
LYPVRLESDFRTLQAIPSGHPAGVTANHFVAEAKTLEKTKAYKEGWKIRPAR